MINQINVDDTVYVIDPWTDMVVCAKVTRKYAAKNTKQPIELVDAQCLYYTHDNSKCFGTYMACKFSDLFASAEDAAAFITNNNKYNSEKS